MTDVQGLEGPKEESDVAPPVARARGREIWLGLFVIIGVLAVLVALFTFTNPSTFRGRYTLATLVDDATGLRHGDAVELRGVAIGRVRDFEISSSGVAIKLEIDKQYRVPRDSSVKVLHSALIGGAVVEVIPGQAPEPALPGSVVPGKADQPLTEKVGTIAAESEETMQRIQELLSQRTVSGIEASVEQLRALLTELAATVAAQRSDLEQTTRNMRLAAQNTKKLTSSPELEQSVERLSSITTKLDDASGSLDRASRSMEVVLARIERGEGTLGRLLKDDTLYRNANQALVNLNQTATVVRTLAMDVQANPQRYVNVSLF